MGWPKPASFAAPVLVTWYEVPATVAKLITPPELVKGTGPVGLPSASSWLTVRVPLDQGFLILTVPPTSLLSVTGLTLPPDSAAETTKAPLARSRVNEAFLLVGQSASPYSRMVPETLCISIESTASTVPQVSIPPPLCATVRLVERHCALIAASSLLSRSAAGQPARAAIGNSFGKPLFRFCPEVTPQEFISCSELMAICRRVESPPT